MKYLLLILCTLNSFAAVPSLEGLLRNPSNSDIDKELVVTSVILSRVAGDQEFKENEDVVKNHFKYLLVSPENTTDFKKTVVVKYEDSTYSVNKVEEVKYLNSFEELISEDRTRNIIQSTILSYAFNNSFGFNKIFKEIEPKYRSNAELINKEKSLLIEKYKNFLVRKKEYEKRVKEESVGDEAAPISPLLSENEEKQSEIKDIMGSSLYTGSVDLKLIKRNRKFLWSVNLDNIKGEFTNEEHQMKHLELNFVDEVIRVVPSSFVTFSGRYSLPKYIDFATNEFKYRLEFVSYYVINSPDKTIRDRAKEYNKFLTKNKERQSAQVSLPDEEEEVKINLLF